MAQPLTYAECLTLALSRIVDDPTHDRHEQIMSKLETESPEQVARFAVYSTQIANLNLRPWESPPCCLLLGEDCENLDVLDAMIAKGPETLPGGEDGNYKVALLLREMLTRGISSYHPDPLAAIKGS